MVPQGRKVALLKGRVRPFGQVRDQKVHAVTVHSRFRSRNATNDEVSECFWTLFGDWDVQKMNGAVAASAFGS